MKNFRNIVSIIGFSSISVSSSRYRNCSCLFRGSGFVRITVDEVDGAFNLVFDPADPESTVEDTVALLAEANVNYDVDFSLLPVQSYSNWASLISVTIDDSVSGFGLPGEVSFNATAYINVIDHLSYGTVPANTHIADVVFTISSI